MMKKFILVLGLLTLTWAQNLEIVGYLPEYRIDIIETGVGQQLDFINYFSMEPDPQNPDQVISHLSEAGLNKVKQIKQQYGTRILITLGGWGRSSGFAAMAADSTSRAAFLNYMLNFLLTNNFDGIDYDWEFPENSQQLNDYLQLVKKTHQLFESHKLLVTVALNPERLLPKEAYDYLDHVHLMSYDHSGEHSTYAQAAQDVQTALNQGIAAKQIYLGVPFYGRHVTSREAFTYQQIRQMYNPDPELDLVNNIFFNNILTIKRKTQLAADQSLGGVMIWEIGQDTKDETSLLLAMNQQRTVSKRLPAPEALMVSSNRNQLNLRFSKVPAAASYRLYIRQSSGTEWDSLQTTDTLYTFSNLPENGWFYLYVTSVDSNGLKGQASCWLAATTFEETPEVCLVSDYDLFDKPADLIRRHAEDFFKLGHSFQSANGAAIKKGWLNLQDFKIVDWFCADAGKYKSTIESGEQQYLKSYLESGGNLLISGSNIGYDLSLHGSTQDKYFCWDYLKARCMKDMPDDQYATFFQLQPDTAEFLACLPELAFDDGQQGLYKVGDPDVLRAYHGGWQALWYKDVSYYYKNAAVYYRGTYGADSATGTVFYLAVPYETLYPTETRQQLLQKVLQLFNGTTEIAETSNPLPQRFHLLANYPNPFNAQTTLQIILPSASKIDLKIYNTRGQTIFEQKRQPMVQGINHIKLNLSFLSSGVYYYQVKWQEQIRIGKLCLIK